MAAADADEWASESEAVNILSELGKNLFFMFLNELAFVVLSIFLRDDKKKVVAVLCAGTILSGFIGYGGGLFHYTPSSNNPANEGISTPVTITNLTSTTSAAITQSLITPTMFFTQEYLPSEITGVWDLNFKYNGYTNSDGVYKERDAAETWSVNLWQTGTDINGELVSVNAKYTDSCTKAYIEGTATDNNLSLFIHFNGTCCPDEIARIDGTIKDDVFFTGNYQPAKTPSGTCTLSTGEVTGIKQ